MSKLSKSFIVIFSGLVASLLIFFGSASVVKAAGPLASDLTSAQSDATVKITGSLLELESTTLPTTILIRDLNADPSMDYIVEIGADTIVARSGEESSNLSFWLVGDVIRVYGEMTNDFTIDAAAVLNTSITGVSTWTQNGWITATDCDNNNITILWGGAKYRIDIVPDVTKIIIPPKHNLTCDDLQVGDRIRGRGVKHATLNVIQAKTIFVLRRGAINYVLRRTERLHGTLLSISSTTAPARAKILTRGDNPTIYTVKITELTKLRPPFIEQVGLSAWLPGDDVIFLVKKETNDTGNTRTAVIAKNRSIWKVGTEGISGTILSINESKNQFELLWGPNNRRFRIDIVAGTKLIKKGVGPITISDLAVGDKIQGRGLKHSTLPIITATIIIAATPAGS